jgi:hypothetical protein
MDADGWDRSDDLRMMARAAGDRVSDRKWRLVTIAASRDARRHHLPSQAADALTLAERLADGAVDTAAVVDAARVIERGWRETELGPLLRSDPFRANQFVNCCLVLVAVDVDWSRRTMWLREVVGNPFRWVRWESEWTTRTVHTLAADAYAAGRFDTLPVLADAMEDAGCDNAELLAHLRGPGPHARGCWALDVVLGKT